jgi:beta-hydroxylase
VKVDKYGRPSKKHPLVSIGRRLRFPLNKFMASQSLIPTDPFLDPASFPELAVLTDKWEQIRDEFLAIFEDRADIPSLSTISPDHRRIAPPEKWKSFFFWAPGYVARKNCELCPVTAAAISELPGVVVAFFSIFEPNTHIPAHRGVTKALINVHLGLVVPQGPQRCEIRVGDEIRRWDPGQLLILDETYEHEAWNESDEPRVVLFLQVKRPMKMRARLLGNLFLSVLRRTSYVQDGRKVIGAE